MKIAPKPKTSAIVTIDELLKELPQKAPLAKPERISQTTYGWLINEVKTANGYVSMELCKETGPVITHENLQQSLHFFESGFRLIGADEFYGLLSAIKEWDTENPSQTSLHDHLKQAWENGPYLTDTVLNYKSDGESEVIHRWGYDTEARIQLKIPQAKHAPEVLELLPDMIPMPIFCAPNNQALQEAWNHTTPAYLLDSTCLLLPTPRSEGSSTVYCHRSRIEIRGVNIVKGIPLIVRTTPVKP